MCDYFYIVTLQFVGILLNIQTYNLYLGNRDDTTCLRVRLSTLSPKLIQTESRRAPL